MLQNVVRLVGVCCIQTRVTFCRMVPPPPSSPPLLFVWSCLYFTCRSLGGSHGADILHITTRWPKSHHSSASQPPSPALCMTYLRAGQSAHHACMHVCVCVLVCRLLPSKFCRPKAATAPPDLWSWSPFSRPVKERMELRKQERLSGLLGQP